MAGLRGRIKCSFPGRLALTFLCVQVWMGLLRGLTTSFFTYRGYLCRAHSRPQQVVVTRGCGAFSHLQQRQPGEAPGWAQLSGGIPQCAVP